MAHARTLLTGARGFVGKAVLERLLAKGHEVVAISSREPPPVSHNRLTWHKLDLLRATQKEVSELVQRHQLSHFLHAAWYTNHSDYLTSEANRLWLQQSKRLADAFYEAGGDRFAGLGTCAEYDQRSEGRFNEESTPLRPATLYGQCKLELFEHLKGRGDFVWVRIFFVYGPHDRAGRLIPHILEQLKQGQIAEARFGGLRRDFIHVEDLAFQVAEILGSSLHGAVNAASGEAIPISRIFDLCGTLMSRPELVRTNDLVPPGESAVMEADMTKYCSQLDRPQIRTLSQGISQLAAQALGS